MRGQLREVMLDIGSECQLVSDVRQLVDLAAEGAEGVAGRWLCRAVHALADDGLFLFVNKNDIRRQSVLCCPGPGHQFLRERLVSQACGLMSEPADQSGCADNFINAVATSLRHQRSQTRGTIQWVGQLPVLPPVEAAS